MALFTDRIEAAEQLANRVQEWLGNNNKEIGRQKIEPQQQELHTDDNIIVLAIPRGGVVIGDIISDTLHAKLDIIVSRKIGAPDNPELAIGAVMPDGSYFLNEDVVNMLNVPKYYIAEQANVQKKEIERRLQSFRGVYFFYIFSLSAIEAWNRVYPFYRASYSAWLTDYMDPNFMELLK